MHCPSCVGRSITMRAYRSNQLPVKALRRLVAMYRRTRWARAVPPYFLTEPTTHCYSYVSYRRSDYSKQTGKYFQNDPPDDILSVFWKQAQKFYKFSSKSMKYLNLIVDGLHALSNNATLCAGSSDPSSTLAVGRVCLRVAVPGSRDNVPQGPFEASLPSIPMHPRWFPTTTTSTAMADRGRDAGPASSLRLLNLGHTTPTRITFITTMPTVDFKVADDDSLDEIHRAYCDGGAALSHLAQLLARTHGPGYYDTGPFSSSFDFGAAVGDRIDNGTRPPIFGALQIR
ncbi:hypothetical protein BJV78DRAFT_1356775 [Lactifluus subvellereus]|nr:hypothetical protein BJV78DRAFT_1356775 [Lactifluus subvellereus]